MDKCEAHSITNSKVKQSLKIRSEVIGWRDRYKPVKVNDNQDVLTFEDTSAPYYLG